MLCTTDAIELYERSVSVPTTIRAANTHAGFVWIDRSFKWELPTGLYRVIYPPGSSSFMGLEIPRSIRMTQISQVAANDLPGVDKLSQLDAKYPLIISDSDP